MTLHLSTVAKSIAGLSIAGVKIRPLDEIQGAFAERDCPVLFPEPLSFITGFVVTVDSTGTGGQARLTVAYNLNYTFLFTPVGSGRMGLDRFEEMVDKFSAILDAVLSNDTITGCVDIQPQEVTEFGPVPDPAGNQFLGARLSFKVTELIN